MYFNEVHIYCCLSKETQLLKFLIIESRSSRFLRAENIYGIMSLLVFCKRAFRKYAPEVLLFFGKELLELGILQGDVLVKSIELKVSFCSQACLNLCIVYFLRLKCLFIVNLLNVVTDLQHDDLRLYGYAYLVFYLCFEY